MPSNRTEYAAKAVADLFLHNKRKANANKAVFLRPEDKERLLKPPTNTWRSKMPWIQGIQDNNPIKLNLK